MYRYYRLGHVLHFVNKSGDKVNILFCSVSEMKKLFTSHSFPFFVYVYKILDVDNRAYNRTFFWFKDIFDYSYVTTPYAIIGNKHVECCK